MKTRCVFFVCFVCLSAFTETIVSQGTDAPQPADLLIHSGIKPIGDWQVDPAETQELQQLFADATAAANSIAPSVDAGAQRHNVHNDLRGKLENFLIDHPNSAYGPAVHIWLGREAVLVSGYSLAIDHCQKAFEVASGSADPTAISQAIEAGGILAKLLALTGQIGQLDLLLARVRQIRNGNPMLGEWRWATEMRAWVRRHPTEAYKCGLYCLDQLGRMTQSGQFLPKNITETDSSTNGFTAADLLNVAVKAGLRIHAAVFTDTNNLPVPSIVHLRSEHFVILRQQRGQFYEVDDPVTYGPRWLLASEIVEEATGCVLVSDTAPPLNSGALVSMSLTDAAGYRGRCHGGSPSDSDDHGKCPKDDDPPDTCPTRCPPGSGPPPGPPPPPPPGPPPPGGPPPGRPPPAGPGPSPAGPGPRHSGCPTCSHGMPMWSVNEPYLNLWLFDTPMPYTPAYGPNAEMRLSFCTRPQQSSLTARYWYGASIATGSAHWNSSWFAFAELSSDGFLANVLMPGGGWILCAFTNNSTISAVSYHDNVWLEKQGPNAGQFPNAVTNLVLHYADGSVINFGLDDTSYTGLTGVFYMTSKTDATGASTTFAYDSNHYLQTVTAADGTYFTLTKGDTVNPQYVTSVTNSYGATTSFQYDSATDQLLTNITDAAGMSSWFVYDNTWTFGDPVTLITPYGTTRFGNDGDGNTSGDTGVFDRIVAITNTVGQVEFYGSINDYGGSDWASFASAAVPTNTPIGTLDTDPNQMAQRDTFYWNAQQFAPYVGTALTDFNYSIFMRGRIRHWLASSMPTYTHWDSLSSEQEPSPDGVTAGQTTWYDYIGKPANANYEAGAQILPSVIARVMPDSSTWYQYFQRLTNGLPISMTEAWMDSGTVHTRSNIWVWAPNNIDLLAWTNATGVMTTSNQYNAFHQVVTNYDALGQVTTNGYDSTTHLLTSTMNPAGLVTLYSYDSGHHIQSIVDLPVNRTNSFSWNSDGTLATHTDPRGMVESYFWDNLHRLAGTSDARGTTTNLFYILSGTPFANSSGGINILDVTAHRDRLGNWTSYVYDALRRTAAVTNANNVVTAYNYCPCGAVSSITNAWNTPVQQVTTFNFDNQGRLTNTLYADGYSFTNSFDLLGELVMTGDGAANRWFTYNNIGLLTSRSNAYGAELTASYDILDRTVYVTDANGVMVTNTFDGLNRLLTRGYPDGGVERFGYSAKGLTAYTNQINMTNYFAYDELGRKTFETNANHELLKYTYAAAGDLLSLTDGKNQTTSWVYDQFGRVTNKVDQAGAVVLRYIYDPEDRLTNRWSAAMGTTSYTFDNIGDLKSVVYPHSPAQSYSYDSLNRLTNMVDAVGNTKYTYTAGNQVWTEVQPFSGSTITNTYSNRLRVAMALQQPTGLWTNGFQYDAAARLTNVASPAGTIGWTLATPGENLTRRIQFPNGCYTVNGYDTIMWRPVSTYFRNSGNITLDYFSYGYNTVGQRTAYTNLVGTYVLFSYDNIGQIRVANSSASSENRGYAYDSAWNLSWLTNSVGRQFTVDGKNELTAWPGGPGTYDSNGNRITQNTGSGATTLSYDDENRLTSWVQSTAYNTGFVYDGLGRLRKRIDYTWTGMSWMPNTTTEYIYDGNRVIQERDVFNTPQVSYTRGIDLSGSLEGAGGIGGLLARSSGYSSGNWTTNHFYHGDANGNITYVVDSNQAMAATYRYDVFGNTLSSSGPLATANVYRFSSREQHAASGMYIYLYRFYDPNSERWLNRDPIEEDGGINLYEFGNNSPVANSDPFGLLPPSAPSCEALKKKIDGLEKAIKEKREEYWQDKHSLPESCPGDDKKPSLSRRGHREMIKNLEIKLKKLKYLYNKNCSDPESGSPTPAPKPPDGGGGIIEARLTPRARMRARRSQVITTPSQTAPSRGAAYA